jgi:hypothetical protein
MATQDVVATPAAQFVAATQQERPAAMQVALPAVEQQLADTAVARPLAEEASAAVQPVAARTSAAAAAAVAVVVAADAGNLNQG